MENHGVQAKGEKVQRWVVLTWHSFHATKPSLLYQLKASSRAGLVVSEAASSAWHLGHSHLYPHCSRTAALLWASGAVTAAPIQLRVRGSPA